MKKLLIKNARIVNEGQVFTGDVLIEGDTIIQVADRIANGTSGVNVLDAEGKYLLPGVIDEHVHFREPGLTHKSDLESGSRAAVAGGITSFIEMPNTVPQATTIKLVEDKYKLASEKSYANYGFMLGATNDNLEEIKKIDSKKIPAIKLFMGSSTGNMLVDNEKTLIGIFEQCPVLIVTHCEDEATIQTNLKKYKEEFGDDIPMKYHPIIRSEEACFISSEKAVEFAEKTGARLHIFHLSTAKEVGLFSNKKPLSEKRITGEVCVHHLWFDDEDYDKMGTRIKWNPAIKTPKDREGLFKGMLDDKIDVIGSDHAPHTVEEKNNVYTKAPSGGPLVQHMLPAMLEFYHDGMISLEKIIEKMCHNPAILFRIEKRGFIREGYKADLCLVDLSAPWTVQESNIYYKCGWSPFEKISFKSRITHTFVNGQLVYKNFQFPEIKEKSAQRLVFNS